MKIAHRIVSWLLLASVVLALGDAPYVDEMFDAIAPRDAQAQQLAPARTHADTSAASHVLRIYRALTAVLVARLPAGIAPAAGNHRYPQAVYAPQASADARRIDRPPALIAA